MVALKLNRINNEARRLDVESKILRILNDAISLNHQSDEITLNTQNDAVVLNGQNDSIDVNHQNDAVAINSQNDGLTNSLGGSVLPVII